MKILLAALVPALLLLSGCGDASESAAAGASAFPAGPIDVPHSNTNGGVASQCATDREWSFSLAGTGLGAHEGRTIWMSAVEPQQVDETTTHEIGSLLEGTIEYGNVSLACSKGLRTNMWYPSVAIVLDADGSGACSNGDLAFHMQFYGWNDNQDYALDGDTFSMHDWEMGTWGSVDTAQLMWKGVPFCEYYGLAP